MSESQIRGLIDEKFGVAFKVKPEETAFALFNACCENELSIIKEIIDRHPSYVCETLDNGYRLHDVAIVFGHLDIVKYLVSKGTDIMENEDYALRLACGRGRIEIVKYLIGLGANVRAEDDHSIMWAAGQNHLEVVKYLVDRGADVAFMYNRLCKVARDYKHYNLIEYLIDLVINQMKKFTLFSLLSKSRAINKDLISEIAGYLAEYIQHYEKY